MSEYILEMRNIKKYYGEAKALDGVDLKVRPGEIHSICGENGAGKSTLMKVLSGVIPNGKYEGEIIYQGKKQEFANIKDSEVQGIVIIHQELALVPYLSIAENIFLGNEVTKGNGVIDFDSMYRRAEGLMQSVNLEEDPATQVREIGVGKQQLVEIAKAIAKDVKVLILDEPTAALNDEDSKNLLLLIEEFKAQGITSIIISHKLNEVMAVSDNITIIRDGQSVETLNVIDDNVTEDTIIRGMVGRALTNRYPLRDSNPGEVLLEVKDWNVYHPTVANRQLVYNANLNVRKGEIVGIAGLMGAGRTELAMSIFGKSYGRNVTGSLIKDGIAIDLNSVGEAIDHGLAYVTEDRKENGLNLSQNINENIAMASFEKFSNGLVVDEDDELENSVNYKESLRIKSNDVFQTVGNLSGGNQQKVVIAKWLTTEPDVLFLDEPTRGIDVGAKYEIYEIVNEMISQGKAVIMISSDLPELLGMCDRIYTMSAGHINHCFDISEATQENLMEYMTKEVE